MAKLIFPLDGMDFEQAMYWAQVCMGRPVVMKTNDLLYAEPFYLGILRIFHALGFETFADVKAYDIPNTAGNTTAKVALLKPHLMTVHASGGALMMVKANSNRGETNILGVTILTSFNAADCEEIYGELNVAKVLQLAKLAELAGIQGIVCSPLELQALKDSGIAQGLVKIVPGVRPTGLGVSNDDQARTDTIEGAIKNGADYLVIGRPITQAENPQEALDQCLKEIEEATAKYRA